MLQLQLKEPTHEILESMGKASVDRTFHICFVVWILHLSACHLIPQQLPVATFSLKWMKVVIKQLIGILAEARDGMRSGLTWKSNFNLCFREDCPRFVYAIDGTVLYARLSNVLALCHITVSSPITTFLKCLMNVFFYNRYAWRERQ